MKPKFKLSSLINYLVFLGIGIGLVWWQLGRMTPEEKAQFYASLQNARYIYVIPIVIIGLFSHLFRALRWKLLIHPIGKVSAENSFYAVMTGYLGNTFIPRFGEILRCSMLSKYEKVPFSKLVGTVITERLFDLVCFILFLLLTALLQLSIVGGFLDEKLSLISEQNSKSSSWIKLLFIAGVIFLIVMIARFLMKKYSTSKPVIKIRGILTGLREGVSTISKLKERKLFLFYTVLIWVMYLSQIYIGFKALDVTEHLGIGAAMSVLALATVAMIVAPGGLGAFPIAVQQVLLIYHVNNISFGWLVWGVNTAMIIVAGIICLLLMIYRNMGGKNSADAGTKEA
ncbi:MAG: flippase-like domain-containing protein [Chitinophagaceae bacterium]|nr:flippase-like domain-containing protein [Chitinophagaceae bacterium]